MFLNVMGFMYGCLVVVFLFCILHMYIYTDKALCIRMFVFMVEWLLRELRVHNAS